MAGKIYFISDPHFGHKNMAKHRGFDSVESHDQTIVKSILDTVKKRDTLWILGDITMERKDYSILEEFTSRGIFLKVVLGNHDKPQHVPELLKYVNSVCGMFNMSKVTLSHAPLHVDELNNYGEFNIHGHIHEQDPPTERHINVSAEYINYIPRTMEELLDGKNIKSFRSSY